MDADHDRDRDMDFSWGIPEDRTTNRINLNESGLDDLTRTLGWSAETARKFIDYRNEHGKFATYEDLRNVPGLESLNPDEALDRFEL